MRYEQLSIDDELTLHQMQASNADEMLAVVDINREYFAEWLPFARGDKFTTVEAYEEFLSEPTNTVGDKEFRFGIFDQQRLIGHIALFNLSQDDKTPEIGYWMSQSAAGKGIMTKVVKRIVSFGFDQLELSEIVINTKPANIGSNRVALKAGFDFLGVIDHETEGETNHYKLSRETWQANSKN